MPTLHQIDEEGYFIHLRWCLPTSVWGNHAVPHASTCPYSSDIRKTFPNIRSNYESFFRGFTSPE